MSEIFKFPNGWIEAKIGEICALVNGKAFKPTEWSSKGLPIIRIQNLNNPDAYYNYCDFKVDDKYYVSDGELLFAWSGTPGTSFGAHIWRNGSAVLNQHIFRVDIDEENVNKFYLMYCFNYKVDEYIRKAHGTAGLAHITKNKFQESLIPLPPFNEQHRIVTKIEELFTKLDAGVVALKQVQIQLKRYRQSVLKAAVEGRLTAEWREQHKDKLEPADKILERILKERREKWQAEQLATYESKGKTPLKNWRDKYEEPTLPDTSNLPELPEGWKWASIDQISYEIRYGSSSKTNMDTNGIPVLRMGNIVDGNLIFDKLKYLSENHNEFPDLLLDSGDLLFNRTNSVELVGKTAVYNGYPSPCSYASYLIRVRFSRGVEPNFISYFINSVYGRAWIRSVVSQQVGQANVNGTKLKNLAVPLPPFDEQKNIVSELERLFSIIYESESLIHREINRAQSLRQSILKRAFEGKLVPQDPKDLPASVLLEKIKAEKAKLKKSGSSPI